MFGGMFLSLFDKISFKSKEEALKAALMTLVSPLIGVGLALYQIFVKLPLLGFKWWAELPDTKKDIK